MPQGDPSPQPIGRLGEPGLLVDGRYRLESLLGAGGFGEVWRASQEVEGAEVRPVALKLLDAPDGGAAGTPRTLTSTGTGSLGGHSWLDEVRAVRDVRCDSIATIFDVGIAREPRVAFIAMELLRGETLDGRLDRGPVYWRRAMAIAAEVVRALVACHEVGVTHCDLKPANVFMHSTGQVYVLDFGVAALGGETQFQRAARAAELTTSADDMFELGGATGAVTVDDMPNVAEAVSEAFALLGTPGYIAPESFQGEAPGPASDVYALGVLLFKMMTGQLPHKLVTEVDVHTATTSREGFERYQAALNAATVRGDLRSLSDAGLDVPSAICELVDSLMAVDPDQRPTASLVSAFEDAWERPYGVPDPPYVGLAAFDRSRAGYIAGRDADIEDVTNKLRERRAVVLTGPSGCGKSSLAIAGVAPRIDQLMLDDTDGWRMVTLRAAEGHDLLRRATDDDEAAPSTDRTGTVVVVDQLEEVLRLDDDDRISFCDALADLAEGTGIVAVRGRRLGPDDPVRVIASVREDLFGPVAALPELRRFPEQNLFTVRGVEPNAMAAIVQGPARAAGFELEGGSAVAEEAVRIVHDDPGALPLVQFALTRWWETRDRERKVLVREQWEKIGGIEGALAEAAQTLYDNFTPGEREHMRALLLALFRHDGTRIRADESEVVDGAASRRVLGRLVDRRLVTRHVDAEGAVSLEVVHEALGRRWPLLHTWLEETRSDRELLHDAQYDAERWERAGKPDDLLWRGARLQAAVERHDRLGAATEFIDRATRLHRGRRRRLWGAGGVAVALVAVGVIITLSWLASNRQRRKAEVARAEAIEQRAQAEEARQAAMTEMNKNIDLRREAEDAKSDSEKQRLAAEQARAEALAAKGTAEQAQKDAERALGVNVDLRKDAEAARRTAETAMIEAQKQKDEADAERARAEKEKRRADAERYEVEKQKKYAETAQKLHEMARKRMEQVERDLDALEEKHANTLVELQQCRAQ